MRILRSHHYVLMALGLSLHCEAGWMDAIPNKDKIVSAVKVAQKTVEASKDIAPHQCYQVGRTFAARVLAQTPPIKDEALIHKVNLIGLSLAMVSQKPEVYAGYSFMVLDQAEPNGFATPGGHVFITKGLLDLCETDDHIAAVLAHEISHVVADHGPALIKKMRWTDTGLTAATEVLANSNSDTTAQLAKNFGDLSKNLCSSVVEKGFGRRQELEADGLGVLNLKTAGFRPEAMLEMIEKIQKKYGLAGLPMFDSHGAPDDRIAHIKEVIATNNPLGKLPAKEE